MRITSTNDRDKSSGLLRLRAAAAAATQTVNSLFSFRKASFVDTTELSRPSFGLGAIRTNLQTLQDVQQNVRLYTRKYSAHRAAKRRGAGDCEDSELVYTSFCMQRSVDEWARQSRGSLASFA